MPNVARKPRLAVVSPFLDKRHGTERRVAEWISRLTDAFEVHVYSQRVEDLDLSEIKWHRIPKLPGPHLLNFLWWFGANHLWRGSHKLFRNLRYDLIFTPGTNCLDADAISVHVIFARYVSNLQDELRLRQNPWKSWPRLVHRKLYYRLILNLERRLYSRPHFPLILISRRMFAQIETFYGKHDECPVVYFGLDHAVFNPERRFSLRKRARKEIGIERDRFALLLVGNDWRNKGFPVLLKALELLRELPIDLLLVSGEDPASVREMVAGAQLNGRVHYLSPRSDVDYYYAAADAYVGPSLEDAFALPAGEAMACGLPVIVSSTMGVSEIVTHGVDGLILQDPHDEKTLALMIQWLWEDPEFRAHMGENAEATAQKYTWDRNARELHVIFDQILQRKGRAAAHTVSRET